MSRNTGVLGGLGDFARDIRTFGSNVRIISRTLNNLKHDIVPDNRSHSDNNNNDRAAHFRNHGGPGLQSFSRGGDAAVQATIDYVNAMEAAQLAAPGSPERSAALARASGILNNSYAGLKYADGSIHFPNISVTSNSGRIFDFGRANGRDDSRHVSAEAAMEHFTNIYRGDGSRIPLEEINAANQVATAPTISVATTSPVVEAVPGQKLAESYVSEMHAAVHAWRDERQDHLDKAAQLLQEIIVDPAAAKALSEGISVDHKGKKVTISIDGINAASNIEATMKDTVDALAHAEDKDKFHNPQKLNERINEAANKSKPVAPPAADQGATTTATGQGATTPTTADQPAAAKPAETPAAKPPATENPAAAGQTTEPPPAEPEPVVRLADMDIPAAEGAGARPHTNKGKDYQNKKVSPDEMPKISQNQVKAVQKMLGFEGKDFDGLWGPQTQAAFEKLASDAGVNPRDVDFTNPGDLALQAILKEAHKQKMAKTQSPQTDVETAATTPTPAAKQPAAAATAAPANTRTSQENQNTDELIVTLTRENVNTTKINALAAILKAAAGNDNTLSIQDIKDYLNNQIGTNDVALTQASLNQATSANEVAELFNKYLDEKVVFGTSEAAQASKKTVYAGALKQSGVTFDSSITGKPDSIEPRFVNASFASTPGEDQITGAPSQDLNGALGEDQIIDAPQPQAKPTRSPSDLFADRRFGNITEDIATKEEALKEAGFKVKKDGKLSKEEIEAGGKLEVAAGTTGLTDVDAKHQIDDAIKAARSRGTTLAAKAEAGQVYNPTSHEWGPPSATPNQGGGQGYGR